MLECVTKEITLMKTYNALKLTTRLLLNINYYCLIHAIQYLKSTIEELKKKKFE